MAKVNDTEQPSESENTGLTPSTVKLKRIMGTSISCRMLTPYEIDLLRKSAQEVAQVVGEVLARKNNDK